MVCQNAVLHEPFPKNHNIVCFTFERKTRQPYNDNLCLIRALDFHLHDKDMVEEEISKV